jgi:hypothetical protein
MAVPAITVRSQFRRPETGCLLPTRRPLRLHIVCLVSGGKNLQISSRFPNRSNPDILTWLRKRACLQICSKCRVVACVKHHAFECCKYPVCRNGQDS